MFLILSKIVGLFLYPLVWILILQIYALFSKNKILKNRLQIFSILLLLILSNSLFINFLFKNLEYPEQEIHEKYPMGIVLGGGIFESNPLFKQNNAQAEIDRLLAAMDLYKENKIEKILISGGNVKVNGIIGAAYNEAISAKEFLIRNGIKEKDIILDLKARNTYENAVYSKKILNKYKIKEKVILITSAYHMKRSIACFEKENIQFKPYPTNFYYRNDLEGIKDTIIPQGMNLEYFQMIFKEYIGFWGYKLTGKID